MTQGNEASDVKCEAAPLPEYTGAWAVCPKCWAQPIGTQYEPLDRLKRTCPRCGYYWYERSRDAVVDKADGEKECGRCRHFEECVPERVRQEFVDSKATCERFEPAGEKG